jgi:hypothetical protein
MVALRTAIMNVTHKARFFLSLLYLFVPRPF